MTDTYEGRTRLGQVVWASALWFPVALRDHLRSLSGL